MLFNLTEAPPKQQNFQWPAANIMCTTYVQSGNSLLQQAVNSLQYILSMSFSQLLSPHSPVFSSVRENHIKKTSGATGKGKGERTES